MTRESLRSRLREINRTHDFQRFHLDSQADRYENADMVFRMARKEMETTGRLDNVIITAMEESIEFLFKHRDFGEAEMYIGTYSALVRHNELVEKGLIGYN